MLGRSHPGGTQQPYGLLRDMLAWRLQIADSDGADAARLRFVQGLQPFFAVDGEEAALRQAEMLGQLIGLDFSASPRLAGFVGDARLLRDGALAAFATWLQRLAASEVRRWCCCWTTCNGPTTPRWTALVQLRERFELPLLLVLAARPDLLERRADWGRGWERHETLALAPLTVSERQTLMRTLLQRSGRPAGGLAVASRRAGRRQPVLRRGDGADADRRRRHRHGKRYPGACGPSGWSGRACPARWSACCRRGWTRWRPAKGARCRRRASSARCSGTRR